MAPKPDVVTDPAEDHSSLLVLAVLALVVGVFVGQMGALFAFRLSSDRLRDALIIGHTAKTCRLFVRCGRVPSELSSRPGWFVDTRRTHQAAAFLCRGGAQR
jgi:CIC family chloride channel protein